MKLIEESSSSSKANDEVFVIAANPINVDDTASTPTAPSALHAARPAERGIIIRKLVPKKPTSLEVPKGKGKKKVKEASVAPSRDSTSFPIRKEERATKENKLKEENWL